jgi:hypothetical protein
LNDSVRDKICTGIRHTGSAAKSVEILKGTQRGLWDLFEDTLAISWLCSTDDEAARLAIQRDIEGVQQAIRPLLRQYCVIADNGVLSFVHEGVLVGGEQARDSWRGLFAETMLRWHKTEIGKS